MRCLILNLLFIISFNLHANINIGLGSISGQSSEMVYSAGALLSKLNWQMNPSPIILAKLQYDLPYSLRLEISGLTTVKKTSTKMDDYDWLYTNQTNWSHWSHHANTNFEKSHNLDGNVTMWVMQSAHMKLGSMFGLNNNYYQFLAKGGCFDYDNHRYFGCIPKNTKSIAYSQKFNAPYVGVTASYFGNKTDLHLTLKTSSYVNSSSNDEHYLRKIQFQTTSDNGALLIGNLHVNYNIKPNMALFLDANYSNIASNTADLKFLNHVTKEIYYLKNVAGLNNTSYVTALGIKYSF